MEFLQIFVCFCTKLLLQISVRVLNTHLKDEKFTKLMSVYFIGTCIKYRYFQTTTGNALLSEKISKEIQSNHFMLLISLYPLKTLENQSLLYVARGIEIEQWHEMGVEVTQKSVKQNEYIHRETTNKKSFLKMLF